MTYANDCIEIRDRAKRAGLKRIEHHKMHELNAAIEKARRKFGDDFWLLLHAIDAYQERRKRRDANMERRLSCMLSQPEDDFLLKFNFLAQGK